MDQLYKKVFLLVLQFISITLAAQQYTNIVQSYLNQNTTELAVLSSDVQDFIILSEQHSQQSDLTHVYIRQRYAGIEVFNGLANLSIKNGQVWYFGNNLISGISAKANTTVPQLTSIQAIEYAVSQLGLNGITLLQVIQNISEVEYIYNGAGISLKDIPVKLVYQATPNNELRLAWDLSINTINGKHWWSVRVDAVSGQILDQIDWVVSCDFNTCSNVDHPDHQLQDSDIEQCYDNMQIISTPSDLTPSPSPPPSTDQYNVFAIPVESPNHGPRTIVTGPFDPLSSPFGWHDTNGSAGAESNNTIGNNVIAQEDANGNNGNGTTANGGAGLNFNLALNISQTPPNYQNVAIINLFYMNNIMHDIWYHYGFDEANGNFQENNYGNGGSASDRVNADAQDGSGLNNANFATPTDGNNPRMQMFLWSAPPSNTNLLTVNAPSALSGNYQAVQAAFGPAVSTTPLTSDFVLVDDNTAPDNQDACEPIVNTGALNGRIAVIRRGACSFVSKVVAAEAAGALAVIMVNNVPGAPIIMGGTDPGIGIPSIMLSQTEGEAIIAALLASTTLNGTLQDPGGPFQIDGDFDNGIIAHEYGHGISNRLAGGRFNSGCLSNAEQMGEGWSDWFGLMLTIEPGDVGSDPRGIGTYAIGEPTTGVGIRPMPYSTNTAVNNATYDLTNNTGSISQPHGIGFVWCTMLWDMSWAFIDAYGYDPNLYTGTGGNNIAMALVIEALKLQPCSPGFVDGRDAILAADLALNGGANICIIWNVFAARGLGLSAGQGNTNSRTDQSEAFDIPIGITTPLSNCILSLSIMPIEILSFDASPVDNREVALEWATGSEINSNFFVAERSKDGIHFEEVGTVKAQGNSQSIHTYSLIDKLPYAGLSYYRLKELDLDNSKSYSNIVAVKINNNSTAVQVVPNPNQGQFKLVIESDKNSDMDCSIYNLLGIKVAQYTINTQIGINTFNFDISHLPSGNFILLLKDLHSGFNETKLIVKD